jgi:SAM-dependent methyltransferase
VRLDWRYKTLAFWILSGIPGGESIHYLIQRYVTKSLPHGDTFTESNVATAQQHVQAFCTYGGRPPGEALFYEFGTGWSLLLPLAFYSFGVNRQYVVDITPKVKIELIQDAIAKLHRLAPRFGFSRQVPALSSDGGQPRLRAQLTSLYGIDYSAPADARSVQLSDGSGDCITSTNTLEHVPVPDIMAILRECRRLLRSDGVVSFSVDYCDHYAYDDPNITVYNCLRYSDGMWKLFSPSIHYQNRLRHLDYRELFEGAGFRIVHESQTEASAADLEVVGKLKVAPRFNSYSSQELSIQKGLFVLRKV